MPCFLSLCFCLFCFVFFLPEMANRKKKTIGNQWSLSQLLIVVGSQSHTRLCDTNTIIIIVMHEANLDPFLRRQFFSQGPLRKRFHSCSTWHAVRNRTCSRAFQELSSGACVANHYLCLVLYPDWVSVRIQRCSLREHRHGASNWSAHEVTSRSNTCHAGRMRHENTTRKSTRFMINFVEPRACWAFFHGIMRSIENCRRTFGCLTVFTSKRFHAFFALKCKCTIYPLPVDPVVNITSHGKFK